MDKLSDCSDISDDFEKLSEEDRECSDYDSDSPTEEFSDSSDSSDDFERLSVEDHEIPIQTTTGSFKYDKTNDKVSATLISHMKQEMIIKSTSDIGKQASLDLSPPLRSLKNRTLKKIQKQKRTTQSEIEELYAERRALKAQKMDMIDSINNIVHVKAAHSNRIVALTDEFHFRLADKTRKITQLKKENQKLREKLTMKDNVQKNKQVDEEEVKDKTTTNATELCQVVIRKPMAMEVIREKMERLRKEKHSYCANRMIRNLDLIKLKLLVSELSLNMTRDKIREFSSTKSESEEEDGSRIREGSSSESEPEEAEDDEDCEESADEEDKNNNEEERKNALMRIEVKSKGKDETNIEKTEKEEEKSEQHELMAKINEKIEHMKKYKALTHELTDLTEENTRKILKKVDRWEEEKEERHLVKDDHMKFLDYIKKDCQRGLDILKMRLNIVGKETKLVFEEDWAEDQQQSRRNQNKKKKNQKEKEMKSLKIEKAPGAHPNRIPTKPSQ